MKSPMSPPFRIGDRVTTAFYAGEERPRVVTLLSWNGYTQTGWWVFTNPGTVRLDAGWFRLVEGARD